jgi:hypothetical protein
MAKKIKFESFKYRLLIAAQETFYQSEISSQPVWNDFVRSIEFSYQKGEVGITWETLNPGHINVTLDEPRFYFRGDSEKDIARQREAGLMNVEDPIKLKNDIYFKEIVMRIAESAGYKKTDKVRTVHDERIQNEREFHDAWAESEDVEKIDVRVANEVYILQYWERM